MNVMVVQGLKKFNKAFKKLTEQNVKIIDIKFTSDKNDLSFLILYKE